MRSLSTAVHPFPESQNLVEFRVRQGSARKEADRLAPPREVLRLCPDEREPLKERHDQLALVAQGVDLPIPAAVAGDSHRSAAERLAEEIERYSILLRDVAGG